MILKVYSVKDLTVGTYHPPMPVPHVGHALRRFQMDVNNPESPYSRWPEQFELHEIGTFDETTAELTSMPPAVIQKAIEAKTVAQATS